MTTLADYIAEVAAMPRGETPRDPMEGPYQYDHVQLMKTSAMPPCGCDVDGYGTLPRPIVIRFCPLHAAAPELLAALRDICDRACWSLSGPKSHVAEVPAAKIERARAAIRTATP